jgi:hypothetical protein
MPKQNMDISAFTISRVTPQPQGSIVSASVLIMKEMKRLVNYKFYKEKGGSKISRTEFKNYYTEHSLFSWCGGTSTTNGKTQQVVDVPPQCNAVLMLWTWNPITG